MNSELYDAPQYRISLNNLIRDRGNVVEIACFHASNKYVASPDIITIERSSLSCRTVDLYYLIDKVSSGVAEIDQTVNAISELKEYQFRYWNTLLRNFKGEDCAKSLYSRVALLATYAYRFRVEKSLRSLWSKMAEEYQNWVLTLLDGVLSRTFKYEESTKNRLKMRFIQTYLGYKRPFSPSGEILKYVDPRSGQATSLEVEHEFGPGVKADLVLKINNRFIVVECKQGPPERWVSKAIKQAEKYKTYANTTILVSYQEIGEQYKHMLSKHYDYVYDKVYPKNAGSIRAFQEQVKAIIAGFSQNS